VNGSRDHKMVIVHLSALLLTPAVSGRAKRGPASLLAMFDGLVIWHFQLPIFQNVFQETALLI
jgi:hypothetical protein